MAAHATRSPAQPAAVPVLLLALAGLVLWSWFPLPTLADRVKDVAMVAGVRSNQLMGYGLVVGLDGTGDQTSQAPFTTQGLRNWLQQSGITLPPGVNPQLKNVAAVAITASLPPFARPGQVLDVTVSSVGNAKSLRGGALLAAPLRGLDGNVYAIAQGNLVVSGFGVQANDGSRISVNVPSSGRIPNGATVERVVPSGIDSGSELWLQLNAADFTTATRLSAAVNARFGAGVAVAVDGGTVKLAAPTSPEARIAFLSEVESLEVDPAAAPARVIINSRTGTVVIGSSVRVSPAAVSHGSLVVTIQEDTKVSQAAAFAPGGRTVASADSKIDVEEKGSRMFLFNPGVSLDEIVRAVNQVGAAPGDLVAILEALQQAGALHAQLVVI